MIGFNSCSPRFTAQTMKLKVITSREKLGGVLFKTNKVPAPGYHRSPDEQDAENNAKERARTKPVPNMGFGSSDTREKSDYIAR